MSVKALFGTDTCKFHTLVTIIIKSVGVGLHTGRIPITVPIK
jgi:hypothetical protein